MHGQSKPERASISRNRKRCRSELSRLIKDEFAPKSSSNGRNLYDWRYCDDLPAHTYQEETEAVHRATDFGVQD
jgi:hypothetical protein